MKEKLVHALGDKLDSYKVFIDDVFEEDEGNNHYLRVVVDADFIIDSNLIYEVSSVIDKTLDELEQGAKVLIPNDPTNRGRSLILLEVAGIIKLKDSKKLDSNIDDIVENPKNLEITALNAEQIGPRLDEVSIAVINTNIALASKIDKSKAIYVESKESPYSNIVAVLKEKENDPKILELMKALQSEKVKKYIDEKYQGEIVSAF